LIGPAGRPRRRSLEDVLTQRELEILVRMAKGKTNLDIANELVIAEGTVKTHVKNILRKLGAATRAQAVCAYCAATRPQVFI
jgi:LuxR family transcriptional regulator, regulator of acetate metabolism